MQEGIEHHIAATDGIFGDAVAGEVQRATFASLATFDCTILRVD